MFNGVQGNLVGRGKQKKVLKGLCSRVRYLCTRALNLINIESGVEILFVYAKKFWQSISKKAR